MDVCNLLDDSRTWDNAIAFDSGRVIPFAPRRERRLDPVCLGWLHLHPATPILVGHHGTSITDPCVDLVVFLLVGISHTSPVRSGRTDPASNGVFHHNRHHGRLRTEREMGSRRAQCVFLPCCRDELGLMERLALHDTRCLYGGADRASPYRG